MVELKIPNEWVKINISDIADVDLGKTPKKSDYLSTGDHKVVKFRDIDYTGIDWSTDKDGFVGEKSIDGLRELKLHDVLITASAHSSEHIGRKICFVNKLPRSYRNIFFCGELLGIRPKTGYLSAKYCFYYFLSHTGYKEIQSHVKGVHLTSGQARNMSFPFTPQPEQDRIIEIVEELFSDLDNAIENLKKAQEQLRVYRRAVLKSAFKGDLTNDWRKNQKNLTNANELIERIKQERESVNESNYGKRHRKMDTSYTDNNRPPYKIPFQWVWCRIKDLIFDLTDYHANGSYENLKANVVLLDEPNYALMIRATNFEKKDFSAVAKYIKKEAYEFLSRSKLFGGEILIGKIGNAGKVYFMPFLNKPASLAMNLFALRFSIINSKYIYYHLISPFSDKDIASYVKGVGNPTIDKISIRSILIAFPPLEEQEHIIQEIESRFSVCDKFEETIESSLNQAESLRQSILKQAFEGKLTEQWRKKHKDLISGENSAEALLKKIKAEKEALQVNKPKGKKKHD